MFVNPKQLTLIMSRLLIVDDSDALLEIMKNILERNNYTVNTLNSAKDIYKKIDEFQPDLVILDVFLAGKDGREICREIKANVETKHTCILVFSASQVNLEEYRSYGADDFIEKPFDISYLIEKIKSVLDYCKNKPAGIKV
jgi:DNA-binding response OmpR family regulator